MKILGVSEERERERERERQVEFDCINHRTHTFYSPICYSTILCRQSIASIQCARAHTHACKMLVTLCCRSLVLVMVTLIGQIKPSFQTTASLQNAVFTLC